MKQTYFSILVLFCTTTNAVQVANTPSALSLVPAPDASLATAATIIDQELSDYEDDYDRDDDDYDERYAREFPYGQPMESYHIDDQKSPRQGRAHIRFIHKTAKPHMYAKKYRTWAPSKEFLRPVKHRPPKKLPYPPNRRPSRRGEKGQPKRRRKMPPRGNQLRRPKPPPESEYDYEDDFYPEESKRNEYTVDNRKRVNKKPRRPPPSIMSLYEEGPQDETISYMNFVQQPSPDYSDQLDDDRPRQPERKRKKKRKKGGGDRVRGVQRDGDQFGATSEPVEDQIRYERFPPYPEDSQPLRRPVRRPAPISVQPVQTTPVYGDGYIGHQSNRPSPNVNIFSGSNRGSHPQYQSNPNYSGAQTFQSQPSDDFQGSPYVPNYDYDSEPQREPQHFSSHTVQGYRNAGQPFSSPVQNQQLNNPMPQTFSRPTTYPNQSPTYPTRVNEYSSKYKSSSFFDNTDTFRDFNQNADFPQNSGSRNNFVPSTEYQEQPGNSETEFITRHRDLYSNGMSGVPVQGDGRQPPHTKDYDIGYGEIHYDETHHTKRK